MKQQMKRMNCIRWKKMDNLCIEEKQDTYPENERKIFMDYLN